MKIKLIGKEFEEGCQWLGCAMAKDGCMYAMSESLLATCFLKIDPTNDSTTLVGPELEPDNWCGCIAGPDGCIYGIPSGAAKILKFDPDIDGVSMVGKTLSAKYVSAAVSPNGFIYFIPGNASKILRYDLVSESTSLIGDNLYDLGWEGAVTASDGCIYALPDAAWRVLRLNPNDDSITYIGNDFSDFDNCFKWSGAVLGADGNTIYGVPCNHNMILKIDVANQSTSLVGPDLGLDEDKYRCGVLGNDDCIYLLPSCAEFILKFDPLTGDTSNVGESLGNESGKYIEAMLAPNEWLYLCTSMWCKSSSQNSIVG